jgi:phosphonate transport system substrate-binding protein
VTKNLTFSVLLCLICLVPVIAAPSLLRNYPSGKAPAAETGPTTSAPAQLRIGLIPERDLFQQRKAYQALALYLQKHNPFSPSVELLTTSSYAGLLKDFEENRIDIAFAGSLVSVLAADRFDVHVLLKSESPRAPGKYESTYSGVLFVREDSPAKSVAGLAGKRVAGVRTTLGGAIFPLYLLQQRPDSQAFDLIWSGTHEDVLREVAAGNVDAGAVKNTRLEAFERQHPDVKFRRLAQSGDVPDNALLVRRDFDPARREALITSLRAMNNNPEGQAVLAGLGIRSFLPCTLAEYASLYDMIDKLGPHWKRLAIDGPAPRRRSTPATRPVDHP